MLWSVPRPCVDRREGCEPHQGKRRWPLTIHVSLRLYPPQVLDDKEGGIIVKGLQEAVVESPLEALALVAQGEEQRHVGATELNEVSSRSHTIFRLSIESHASEDKAVPPTSKRTSILSLIDLAGSENAKLTNAKGGRQREGQFINKSLLALGHVIQKLSEATGWRNIPGSPHIPFRDSKLTRFLQPALEGNALVAIVCSISSAVSCLDETHHTLKFASRAKKIQVQAAVNEIPDEGALLVKYQEEIVALRAQLARASALSATSPRLRSLHRAASLSRMESGASLTRAGTASTWEDAAGSVSGSPQVSVHRVVSIIEKVLEAAMGEEEGGEGAHGADTSATSSELVVALRQLRADVWALSGPEGRQATCPAPEAVSPQAEAPVLPLDTGEDETLPATNDQGNRTRNDEQGREVEGDDADVSGQWGDLCGRLEQLQVRTVLFSGERMGREDRIGWEMAQCWRSNLERSRDEPLPSRYLVKKVAGTDAQASFPDAWMCVVLHFAAKHSLYKLFHRPQVKETLSQADRKFLQRTILEQEVGEGGLYKDDEHGGREKRGRTEPTIDEGGEGGKFGGRCCWEEEDNGWA